MTLNIRFSILLKSLVYLVIFCLSVNLSPIDLSNQAKLNTIFLIKDKLLIEFPSRFLEWSSSRITSNLQCNPHSIFQCSLVVLINVWILKVSLKINKCLVIFSLLFSILLTSIRPIALTDFHLSLSEIQSIS